MAQKLAFVVFLMPFCAYIFFLGLLGGARVRASPSTQEKTLNTLLPRSHFGVDLFPKLVASSTCLLISRGELRPNPRLVLTFNIAQASFE